MDNILTTLGRYNHTLYATQGPAPCPWPFNLHGNKCRRNAFYRNRRRRSFAIVLVPLDGGRNKYCIPKHDSDAIRTVLWGVLSFVRPPFPPFQCWLWRQYRLGELHRVGYPPPCQNKYCIYRTEFTATTLRAHTQH